MVKPSPFTPTSPPGPPKTFVQQHTVKRGDLVLCEGTEVRAFCIRDPGNPDRIKAIPVPEDIKALCV